MSAFGDRATDLGYALGWTLVRRMPERTADALFRRIADRAWRRRGRRVLQLEANLRRVVGEVSKERMDALTQAAMRSYLRYWLEVFRLPDWSRDELERRIRCDTVERITEPYEAGRGQVLVLPHMANWDLAGAWAVRYAGGRLTTVAERLKPESLYDRFIAYRESIGMEVLPITGGDQRPSAVLATRLREGGLVCLLADRDLTPAGVEVDFFGEKATMPAGPAALALSTGAALVPVTLSYEDRHCHVNFHPRVLPPDEGTRAERIAAMTQAMADAFAKGIAARPEDWHMLQPLWAADVEARRQAKERDGSR